MLVEKGGVVVEALVAKSRIKDSVELRRMELVELSRLMEFIFEMNTAIFWHQDSVLIFFS